MGLEDLLCDGRLRDQGLFSQERGIYRAPNSSLLVLMEWLLRTLSHALTVVRGGNMRHKGQMLKQERFKLDKKNLFPP